MQSDKYIQLANILMEALPYIQKLAGKTVVIKYGGNAMLSEELSRTFFEDITLLKYVGINPIVIHGGGPEINRTLERLGIESRFEGGLRVTDAETIDVVQMVLAGRMNKDIVAKINCLGGKAIGLCGKDASLLRVKKKTGDVDLGYVGEIARVETKLLETLCADEYIPVIAPIGAGEDGQSYNINADTVAGAIAAALKAEKLIFLTDIDGIYEDPKDPSTLMPVISIAKIHDFIAKGIISGGMIPKVKSCIESVEAGVSRTHIVNGTIPHPIVLEIFTDSGIGTMVERGKEA